MDHTRPKSKPKASKRNTSTSNVPGPSTKTTRERVRPPATADPSREAYPIFRWQDNVTPGTNVQYLREAGAVNMALESVKGPFGFDIEWKPTFIKGQREKPIALLQLARPDQVFLVQLTAMAEFPERLRDILEDREIVKIGVGISGDAKKLWRDYGVSLLTAVELSKLARAADPSRWSSGKPGELISLARLVEAYKSRQLSKSKKVKLSNWELQLTTKQIDYAASDALAGFLIYQHLLGLDSGALVPPQDYTSDFIGGKHEPYVRPEPVSLQSEVVDATPNP